VGFFKNHKENRELNEEDREARRDAAGAALEARDVWREKAGELSAQYAGAIQAASSVDINEMQRTAQRVQRISTQGIPGKATVVSAREIGQGMAGVGATVEFELDLISGPRAPRRLTIRQDVMGGADSYPAGVELPVKVDPDDDDDAMIWADVQSAGSATTGPDAAGIDRVGHLEALAQLRERGALSDEQFQQAKARLLSTE
jgi:Short C-terminal domain